MISDYKTNFLYLADTLPQEHPTFYKHLTALLKQAKISFGLIPNTKDIWAKDFMPIQVASHQFVNFVYEPDYLENEEAYKTDGAVVAKQLNIASEPNTINLDGGNVVAYDNKVILCDKIFRENKALSADELIRQLEGAFDTQSIYFVPQLPEDKIGHADGMVRFIDADTVLINDMKMEDPLYASSVRIALRNAGFKLVEMPYKPNLSGDSAKGIYINYMHIGQVIIVPQFGYTIQDAVAIKILENYFPECQVHAIDCNELAKGGGVLNCVSWGVLV